MANRMIEEIHGIGLKSSKRLRELGITGTQELLHAARTAPGRADLAERTGLSATRLLRWAHRIDLCRVDGVEPEGAELLEAAGVATLRQLRDQKAAELATRCRRANVGRRITLSDPSQQTLQDWIDRAARLPEAVED